MPMKHFWPVAALVLAAFTGMAEAQRIADPSVRAQDDARERAEQLDREGRVRQSGDPVLSDELQRRPLPPAGGPTVVVRSVVFEPRSAFFSQSDLDALTRPFVGQRLDFRGISQLVRGVNDLYAQRGIVTAAAILPPQDLSSGNLRIQLVEGRLGGVTVVGNEQTDPEFVLNRITLSRDGDVVDVPQIAEDLNFFNKTSRAKVRMLLQPGAAFGLTNLSFGITEPPKQELQFFLGNEGVESTGEFEVAALYRRYGIFGRDDSLLAYLEFAEGSESLVLTYDVPITPQNTRLSFGFNASSIDIVDGPAEPLDVEGESYSFTVGVTHPLFVDENWVIQGKAGYFYGPNESSALGITLVDTDTQKFNAGIDFGYTGERLSMSGDLQVIAAEVDNKILGRTRDITLVTGSLFGFYALDDNWNVQGSAGFQWTDEELIPGNLLYQIGGPQTVRGYPSEGVAGDDGYYLSLELHRPFPVNNRTMDVFGFVDHGKVFSTFPDEVELTSVGFGASYDLTDRIRLDVTAAFPVEDTLPNQDDATVYATLRVIAF